jgi:hypothetical protein
MRRAMIENLDVSAEEASDYPATSPKRDIHALIWHGMAVDSSGGRERCPTDETKTKQYLTRRKSSNLFADVPRCFRECYASF